MILLFEHSIYPNTSDAELIFPSIGIFSCNLQSSETDESNFEHLSILKTSMSWTNQRFDVLIQCLESDKPKSTKK